MPHRTFFWFIIPSLAAMILFIALPVISVITQSLHVEHEKVLISSENCGPFGCKQVTIVDVAATTQLRADQPLGQFTILIATTLLLMRLVWPGKAAKILVFLLKNYSIYLFIKHLRLP
jgi:hypothetical protein